MLIKNSRWLPCDSCETKIEVLSYGLILLVCIPVWQELRLCLRRVRRVGPRYYKQEQQYMLKSERRDLHYLCTPHLQHHKPSGSRRNYEMNSRDRVARGGREVTTVVTNPTVGPDGCGGQVIYVRWEGASQEEAPIYHGRQSFPEGILNGQQG